MDISEVKLESCAHCGSEAEIIDSDTGVYVECVNFDCQIRVGSSDWTTKAAIDIWNNRARGKQ